MYEIRDSLSELFETSDLAVAFDFREPGWTARGALGSRCVWAADIGMCPLGFWASKRGAAFGAACKYTDRADTLLDVLHLERSCSHARRLDLRLRENSVGIGSRKSGNLPETAIKRNTMRKNP